MSKREKVLAAITWEHEQFLKKTDEHFARVNKAMDWWDEHYSHSLEEDRDFVHCIVNIEGKKAMCIYADFRGAPYFNSVFNFRPLKMSDDIGAGCGKTIEKKF